VRPWAQRHPAAWPCARPEPVVTDQGNLVLDLKLAAESRFPHSLEGQINNLPGCWNGPVREHPTDHGAGGEISDGRVVRDLAKR